MNSNKDSLYLKKGGERHILFKPLYFYERPFRM